jgi:hypothetical protein
MDDKEYEALFPPEDDVVEQPKLGMATDWIRSVIEQAAREHFENFALVKVGRSRYRLVFEENKICEFTSKELEAIADNDEAFKESIRMRLVELGRPG